LPSALAVTPSGTFLFAANSADNNVSVLGINADGTLSNISGSPFLAGTNPISAVVHPNGNFLYIANRTGGISAYSIASDGALTLLTGTSASLTNGISMALDPTQKYVLAASQNSLQELTINNVSGTSTATSVTTNGSLSSSANSALLTTTPGQIFVAP
jgi:6-phosphogluconolactonase